MEATLERPKVESAPCEPLSIVQKKCPVHSGLVRKVHKITETCFRINFHNPDNANYVEHSYFAQVVSTNKVKFSYNIKVNEHEYRYCSKVI